MKPILSQQVKRGQELKEWEPAEHQSTMDGLNAFAARQEARKLKAQASNVRPLQRKGKA